jgi:hypothetical protein
MYHLRLEIGESTTLVSTWLRGARTSALRLAQVCGLTALADGPSWQNGAEPAGVRLRPGAANPRGRAQFCDPQPLRRAVRRTSDSVPLVGSERSYCFQCCTVSHFFAAFRKVPTTALGLSITTANCLVKDRLERVNKPFPSGRIVIAGGSGFLGVSLAEHLAVYGEPIVILSRRSPKVTGGWRHVPWDARNLGEWKTNSMAPPV